MNIFGKIVYLCINKKVITTKSMLVFEDDDSKFLTLSALNAMVRDAIEMSMPDEYWVQAELASVRENNGHCYMELVEKDDATHTPIAQARACCWRQIWHRVGETFVSVTGQPLSPGMKVLVRVRASFHEAFGFSWIVTDIDPTFTVGDMARRRQEIIRILTEEGVVDLNKTLPIPHFAQRIAVISSATAAGYGDFCNQLYDNDYGLHFEITLFAATMQGEQVEASVISALDAINARCDDFDVVVIIRGGGSTADLSGFDTLALAENVANFPLPVITGIGHDRDQSVLDIIACVSVKTPTAAAAFLIDNLAQTLERIENAALRIGQALRTGMERERMRVMRIESELKGAFAVRKAREEGRLNVYEERLKALDPRNILKRGYTMTLRDGVPVTSVESVGKGDTLETVFADGKVTSRIV